MHHDEATIDALLAEFIAEEKLPEAFSVLAHRWYAPLLSRLQADIATQRLQVLGISGSQGSGKSTLAKFLQLALQRLGLRVVPLSLDDFYLTRREREQLAHEVHPLLATRGVPGTHDVPLALDTIQSLLSTQGQVSVPRFNKALDDRKPPAHWDHIAAPVDLVILEGWCVSAPPQTTQELAEPINQLERDEDRDGIWRRFVNNALQNQYKTLFDRIDQLIMLQAPNFEAVYRWRGRQEQKLRLAVAGEQDATSNQIMGEPQLRRFIQHYERLTRRCLTQLPTRADIVFKLNDDQIITECIHNPSH